MLDMPTRDLLNEFSKGIGMTGSGAVTVLSAISGVHLLVSVCKLTRNKKKYEDVHEEVKQIQEQLQDIYLPRLETLMEEDIAVVRAMLGHRVRRDKAADDKQKAEHKKKADALLKDATDSVMEFCRICLEIIPKALYVYKNGLKSAQGDTAAVLSIMLSGASSALYAVLVNIKAAKGADWTAERRAEAEVYFGRLPEYQYIFSGKLATLYNKT